MRSYLFLLSSSLRIAVVAGFVVVAVAVDTRTESARAVFTAWRKLVWEQPLPVKTTIVGELVEGLLEEAVALSAGALLTTMAILVNETISKLVDFVTVIVIHEVTIRVGLLEGEGLHLDGLEVSVLEGSGEGAAVGSHGRQLAAVGGHREHRDRGPRLRDGDIRAGTELWPRWEAWR